MATMIPAGVPGKTPQSERQIFDRLRLDPETKDWIVLHSVGLSKTNRGPYGEIDFVILIPGKGIVCLEVKGGLVRCQNGVWTTTNRKTTETKKLKVSPYMQAREGMFALKKGIERKFGRLEPVSSCPLSYAVVFPSVSAPPQSPGEDPWETIDIEALRQPISKTILRNIDGTRKKLTYQPKAESVSDKSISEIRQYLRPDFDRVITRSSTIRRSEERLISLTKAQYDYLDIADVNDRALIEGAAGTGKTVLAIEFARREALCKRNVLLLCFNRVLAAWLGKQFSADERSLITVGSFHSYLRSLITGTAVEQEFNDACAEAKDTEIFQELLPFYAELTLNELGSISDTLIIDEAQDLISKDNMPVLNLLVTGGLAGGRWAIFGDFARQAIYADSRDSVEANLVKGILNDNCAFYTTIPLNVNCRNTRPIGEETALLSGFDSLPYRLAQVDGLPVDYRYWKSKDDEAEQLTRSLTSLLDDGVAPQDIVVLAPTRFEKSAAATIKNVNGVPVSDFRDVSGEPGECIIFSTIQSFKGMESPAVVMCGILNIDSDESRSLLYVGMSRARSHLIMVVNEKLKAALPELTRKRLSGDWQ